MSLAFFLTALIFLPFIAVPFLIWYSQRFSAEVNLRVIQETFLPSEVLDVFRKFGTALSKHKFEYHFDAVGQDQLLGLRFYHRVLMNQLENTWGICVAICDDEGNFQKDYAEFKTQFVNKTSFATHNCNLIDTPIKAQQKKSFSLPAEVRADTLFEIHQFYLKKETQQIMPLPSKDSAVLAFKQFFADDNEELLSLGAIYFDEPEKLFRPTLAGAALIGWYNMWPFTSFRRIWTSLKFKHLMRQLASTNS